MLKSISGLIKRYFHALLFFIGLALFISLIARLGIEKILSTIVSSNFAFVFFGVLVYICACLVRSFKWKLISDTIKLRQGYKKIVMVYFVNQFFANLTPGRLGETITPFIMKDNGKNRAKLFSLLFIDKVFEMLAILSFFLFGIIYYVNMKTGKMYPLFIVLASLMVLLISILAIVAFSRRIVIFFISKIKMIKTAKIEKVLDDFYRSFGYFREKRENIAPIMLFSIIGLLLDTLSFYLIVLSVFKMPFILFMATISISIVVAITSAIPSGIGAADISFVSLLAFSGYPGDAALSAMVLQRIFILGTLTLIGLFCLAALKNTKKT